MKSQPSKIKNTKNESFAKAFITLKKCKPEEIDITIIDDNEAVFVIYDNRGYNVVTENWLYNDVMRMLTDEQAAMYLNGGIWADITSPTMTISQFLPALAKTLKNAEQARLLNLALSINSFAEDGDRTFWHTLERIDDGCLLGNAIVTAAASTNNSGDVDQGITNSVC